MKIKALARSLLLFPLFAIWGCPAPVVPCYPERTEYWNLSDETLSLYPYKDKEILVLRHNQGKEIEFNINYSLDYSSICVPDEEIHYEIKTQTINSSFTTDYLIFDIYQRINKNLSGTSSVTRIGSHQFTYNSKDQLPVWKKDSLNTQYYALTGKSYRNDIEAIFVDTLIITEHHEIVKLLMNNEEFYEVVKY